jgi:hypothetical protein
LAVLDDDDEPIFSASKKDFGSIEEAIFSPSKKDCLSPAPLSAHVHFPGTPSLTATFTTHSPNSYDRAPICVAPNPCELPPRGDRVYEPLENIFSPKKSKFRSKKAKYPSDVTIHDSITSILESSGSSDESDNYVYTKPKSAMSVKFALHAPPSPIPRAQSKEEIEKALTFLPYPLSPYPRSLGKENNAKKALSPEKGEVRREVKRANSLAVPSPEGRTVTPVRPVQTKKILRRPAELNLSEPSLMRPPGLWPVLSSVPESPASTGITLDVPSSVTGSDGHGEGSSELSAAFWLSVTVEETPEEVVPVSPFLFGRSDGSLWSPGLPRKSRASSTDMMISRSIFSPGVETFDDRNKLASITSPAPVDPIATFASFTTALNVEKHLASVTSPAPNDPIATFTSFSAALTYLGSDPVITFPPSVELKAERSFRR